MRHTQKSKLSPSLGCIQILKNGKRKSTSVSLYSIQTEKLFTLWSFGVPMKTAGNTGVALQGLAKYCLNVFVAYNWKWNIFVDSWHVWTNEVLWWCYNLNSHGNYLQWGTASHNCIETDLSVLTMTFGTPEKKKKKLQDMMLNFPPVTTTGVDLIKDKQILIWNCPDLTFLAKSVQVISIAVEMKVLKLYSLWQSTWHTLSNLNCNASVFHKK